MIFSYQDDDEVHRGEVRNFEKTVGVHMEFDVYFGDDDVHFGQTYKFVLDWRDGRWVGTWRLSHSHLNFGESWTGTVTAHTRPNNEGYFGTLVAEDGYEYRFGISSSLER